jgi:hypothetical protein
MKIEYNTSVYTSAGWRPVTITAAAHHRSPKMLIVDDVLLIDGEEPTGYTSRTGAKRQRYHAAGIRQREIGTVKRLSSVYVEKS